VAAPSRAPLAFNPVEIRFWTVSTPRLTLLKDWTALKAAKLVLTVDAKSSPLE